MQTAGVTGRTIRVFLADGEPTGILLAEISNWTGKALVATRSQLDQFSKREEVRRTGVYLLAGPDPDDPSRAPASIGEGDNVVKRLLRRSWDEGRDFWERAVVIVSKDENLSQGGVRHRHGSTPALRSSYANSRRHRMRRGRSALL